MFRFLAPSSLRFTWYGAITAGGTPTTPVNPSGKGIAPGSPGAGIGFTHGSLISVVKEVRTAGIGAGIGNAVEYNLFDFGGIFQDVGGYFSSMMIYDIIVSQGKNVTLENFFTTDPTKPVSGSDCKIIVRHDNPGGRGGEPADTDLWTWTSVTPTINGMLARGSSGVAHILPTVISCDDDGVNSIKRTMKFRLVNQSAGVAITEGVYRVNILMMPN